jgi:hypothetical protein
MSTRMGISAKMRRAPLRIVTGAFILNAGISKLSAGEEQAQGVQSMAAGAYPVVEKVPPTPFVKALAIGETALGTALLLPFVPAGAVGLALTGFSGGLLGMWWRTPGMHEEHSLRPTQRGTPIAKDVWMLGIGTSLLIDAAISEARIADARVRAQTRATIRAETKVARRATRRAARRAARRAVQGATKVLPN